MWEVWRFECTTVSSVTVRPSSWWQSWRCTVATLAPVARGSFTSQITEVFREGQTTISFFQLHARMSTLQAGQTGRGRQGADFHPLSLS